MSKRHRIVKEIKRTETFHRCPECGWVRWKTITGAYTWSCRRCGHIKNRGDINATN